MRGHLSIGERDMPPSVVTVRSPQRFCNGPFRCVSPQIKVQCASGKVGSTCMPKDTSADRSLANSQSSFLMSRRSIGETI